MFILCSLARLAKACTTLPPTNQVKLAIVLFVSVGTGFLLGSTDALCVCSCFCAWSILLHVLQHLAPGSIPNGHGHVQKINFSGYPQTTDVSQAPQENSKLLSRSHIIQGGLGECIWYLGRHNLNTTANIALSRIIFWDFLYQSSICIFAILDQWILEIWFCFDHTTTALPQHYHRHHCNCPTQRSSRGILFVNLRGMF